VAFDRSFSNSDRKTENNQFSAEEMISVEQLIPSKWHRIAAAEAPDVDAEKDREIIRL
jgi:hypothetical protein